VKAQQRAKHARLDRPDGPAEHLNEFGNAALVVASFTLFQWSWQLVALSVTTSPPLLTEGNMHCLVATSMPPPVSCVPAGHLTFTVPISLIMPLGVTMRGTYPR
jgi:hypothetical protein